jgi:hypothetical protein
MAIEDDLRVLSFASGVLTRIVTYESDVDKAEALHYYLTEVEILVTQIEEELEEVIGCGYVSSKVQLNEHHSLCL